MSKVAVVAGFLMILVVACTVTEDDVQQAEIDIADALIDVEVTATRMYEDYEANRVAADQEYDGKVLVVSGTVETIAGGDDSPYYIDLATGELSLVSVRCYFSQSHLDELTKLQTGDRVALRGMGDESEDRNPFTVDVIACSVLE